MSVAVVTFVYNESVNLPIWRRYYAANFGERNLFVADRESTDGSTADLGAVNRLTLPHTPFDEFAKTGFINALHRSLLHYYDTVIYTDCDEIIVPGPAHVSLDAYLRASDFDYVSCVGLNVLHLLNEEDPLEPDRPILRQRRYARFFSPTCKTLISRVPIQWLPGIHSCDKPPKIDPDLYLFHTKTMDYAIAMRRQAINRATEWSEASLAQDLGAHHRYDRQRFVREAFLDPMNGIAQGQLAPFEFSAEIARIAAETRPADGFFHIPMDIAKLVAIPDELKDAF